METGSIQSTVVGGFAMLVGILMIVFHSQVREISESLHQAWPEALTRFQPRGKQLTISIVGFGAVALLGGLAVLLVNFVEP